MTQTALLNPGAFTGDHLDPKSRELCQKTIDWFENKGLTAIKQDDMAFKWYDDFIRFQKKEGIFAHFLTPAGYGDTGSCYDLNRISTFNELLGFYSMSHRYAFQVSILGTGPIWMSDNESVKKRTAGLLQAGEIFGFGVSEKEHGADLYANETTLNQLKDGTYIANGNKYYIGNANKGFVSTIGKIPETGEYAFFLVDSKHRHYNAEKRILTSCIHSAYVGQYEMIEYPITEADIISRGDKALQDALATINIGKFQVGVTPVGSCTHALYESINHSHNRIIYGQRVTDFPHIRELLVEAYTRLAGMKIYNNRVIDYFKASSPEDRRYLAFTPISKMKVGMEAIRVTQSLLDVTAAKGFETDTYLEMSLRDVAASSRLEGTTHVNMALILKFIEQYLMGDTSYDLPPRILELRDDANIFNQVFGNMKAVMFPDCGIAYQGVSLPNALVFREQLDVLRTFFAETKPGAEKRKNLAYMYNLGEMFALFALVPYAQLILEGRQYHDFDECVINRLFGYLVSDFSSFALKQIMLQDNSRQQEELLHRMIRKPEHPEPDFNRIWSERVETLNGLYKMND